MGEARPAPKYGEYAPAGWVSPVPPVEPADVTTSEPGRDGVRPDTRSASQPPPPSGTPVPGAPPVVIRRGFNTYASVLLLGIGLVTVLENLLRASSIGSTLLDEMKNRGYYTNGFTRGGALTAVGIASSIFAVIVYIVVAVVTLRRLRAGKLAWFIPLAAGALVYLVIGVSLAVVILSDPTVSSHMGNRL